MFILYNIGVIASEKGGYFMATHAPSNSHQDAIHMTMDCPVMKYKQHKAVSEKTLNALDEESDIEAFDRGLKSIKENGYDTIKEVKYYLRQG